MCDITEELIGWGQGHLCDITEELTGGGKALYLGLLLIGINEGMKRT